MGKRVKTQDKKQRSGKATTDRKDSSKSSRASLKKSVGKNAKMSAKKAAKGSPKAGSSRGGGGFPCDQPVDCPLCPTTISRYIVSYSLPWSCVEPIVRRYRELKNHLRSAHNIPGYTTHCNVS